MQKKELPTLWEKENNEGGPERCKGMDPHFPSDCSSRHCLVLDMHLSFKPHPIAVRLVLSPFYV